jgi:hypothetical protein
MKNERIECTFQDASTRAKKEGGIFWARDVFEPYKYSWDDDLQYYVNQSGNPFEFNGSEFDIIWIYEPPQKSAFQECESKYLLDSPEVSCHEVAKDFWNSAIDACLKVIDFPFFYSTIREKIKELREP